jgi:hypothetical protein
MPRSFFWLPLPLMYLVHAQPADELLAARQRVALIARQLQMRDEPDYARYLALRDGLTAQVHREVEEFFLRRAPERGMEQPAAFLEQMQAEFGNASEFSNTPFVWPGELRRGKAVVAGYLLLRQGGNDSACAIRAYREEGGRTVLAGATGGEMDGYGLMLREIASPVPGELWILAHGNRFTFNGKLVRYRLYAFDGETFRTLWSPEDKLDGEIEWSEGGFAIESTNPAWRLGEARNPRGIREEFLLYADGPKRVRSSYTLGTR